MAARRFRCQGKRRERQGKERTAGRGAAREPAPPEGTGSGFSRSAEEGPDPAGQGIAGVQRAVHCHAWPQHPGCGDRAAQRHPA